MRKPSFCICENKDADQLCGNREADQRLCFRFIASTIPVLPKYKHLKPLAIFCDCTGRFVSDQVKKPEDRFSHNEAQIEDQPGYPLSLISLHSLHDLSYSLSAQEKTVIRLGRCPGLSESSLGVKPNY